MEAMTRMADRAQAGVLAAAAAGDAMSLPSGASSPITTTTCDAWLSPSLVIGR
jgi:hypothetical protein